MDHLDLFNKAVDEAVGEFMNEPNSIFGDLRERNIYKYTIIEKLSKWKKGKKCIVKDCSNKSIARSHTIQKSGPIKLISEKGHVLTPKFNKDTGEMQIVEIGINEASTFPGYCSEHEKLFTEFENKKEFNDEKEFGLQMYRTVCREIVINENSLETIDLLINKYKEFRNNRIKESIVKKLDSSIKNNPTFSFKSFKIENEDSRLKAANKYRKETIEYLENFLYKYENAILKDLKKEEFTHTCYLALTLDEIIPVGLAGSGIFYLKIGDETKKVNVLINVLPLTNQTYLFISALKKFEEEINFYLNQFPTPIEMINMVESWMIYGSDHWFINSSTWNEIKPEYQKKIASDITDTKHNISSDYTFTIFNGLKLKAIAILESNYNLLDERLLQLLHKEKAKLTSTETQ